MNGSLKTFDFTHSMYIYTLPNLSVFGLCLRLNDYTLFTWISLTAFSDLFYWCALDGADKSEYLSSLCVDGYSPVVLLTIYLTFTLSDQRDRSRSWPLVLTLIRRPNKVMRSMSLVLGG